MKDVLPGIAARWPKSAKRPVAQAVE